MNVNFTRDAYVAIRKAGAKSPVFQEEAPYSSKDVQARMIDAADFELIKKEVKKPSLWQFIENRRVYRKIENLEKLKARGAKSLKITKLEMLVEALRDLIEDTPNKWLFLHDTEHRVSLPYFISNVEYVPPRIGGQPLVLITGRAISRGKRVDGTVSFRKSDLGSTALEMLSKKNVMLESDGLIEDHRKDVEKYRQISPRTGEQYLATGIARTFSESRWNRDEIFMDRDGQPTKIVLDDQMEYGANGAEESGHYATAFWHGGNDDDDDDTEDESAQDYILPVLPFVRAFDLWRHEFILIHTANLKEYQYDATISSKLVLPDNHQTLIEALTVGTAKRFDDVVKGKAQGVIILCTGAPGTGKTLSAEVYSEVAKRPLYTVQCSQLGTQPDALEKNLAVVLEQATRWRAILLIDEADVYIHERGSDVSQNAIVGVFLRLLEYYNGILFMNTNREQVIDDAILSRATAHVRYLNPDSVAASRIWKILADNYGVKMSDALLTLCLKEWRDISGRSIRQVLRLAKMMADRQGLPVTMDDLKFSASFQDLQQRQDGGS